MKNISKTINTKTSGTTSHSQSRINPLLLFNISMYTLAAICFMVYTTELTYVHAEGNEDLGSASSSLDVSVAVGTACNFSGNVDIPHTSTIMNGVNSTDIGKTTMNVTCNDEGGYAVYAIGYTNDEYGNTALKSSISDDYNISTGTSTSGNTSNWSMKLATVSGTTTATIENGYSNYNTVPDDYTKVATLNTITNPDTSTTGSSISTTYQTYISPTQPAGTYTGKVKYTLVHPSTAPASEKPKTIDDLTYMQEFGTISEEDLANVKASMPIETTYTLKDQRDNQDYTIAKLKDGKIWMTKNLNLAGGTALSADTTDVDSSYISSFSTSNNLTKENNTIKLPASATAGFYSDNYSYVYNTGKNTSNCSSPGCYSYYSWDAATLGSGRSISTENTDAPYSICPKGWRLPTSGNSSNGGWKRGDFYALATAYGADLEKSYYQNSSTFYNNAGPNTTVPNFLLAGRYGDGSFYSGGSYGRYWSSTSSGNSYYARSLYFESFYVNSADSSYRRYGFSVRCLVK